jgi:putative exosortase-associated protein (TIGR04073 family)
MKSKKVLALVAFFVFCGVFSSQAGYMENIVRKLGRGVCNVVGVPFELCANIEDVAYDEGLPAACTYGVMRGVYHSVTRCVVGVYEVATFPISQGPIVEPEFVWGDMGAEYDWEL